MTLLPDRTGRRILLIVIVVIMAAQASAQSYCRPSLGSCCEWISNVSINTINNNTPNESGYADYTSVSTVLSKGTTYPISVKISTNSIYIEHVKVFFDWDRDFIFESSVYLGSAKFTGNNVFTGTVTVPTTALDGCSMMRVFMQYAKEPSGACASNGDGEVEDYTLVVSNSAIPLANFAAPSTACMQQAITFENTSAISDGAPLAYSWNFDDGTTSAEENPTKTFAAAGTYNVKLTASTFCTSHSITKTVVVNKPPTIVTQPVNSSACPAAATIFSITSSADDATYQWQVDKGTGFSDLVNNVIYSNTTASSLNISGVVASMNGYQYRCVVTKNCPVISAAASLTVSSPPTITSHPANVSACSGENAVLEITAGGTGLSYQWQVNKGNGFEDLSNDAVYRNVTTRALMINEVADAISAYQYRCVVSGLCTSTSQPAEIKIKKAAKISTHPSDATGLMGSQAVFSILASGDNVTYQWQENTGDGFVNLFNNEHFKNTGTATLTISNLTLTKNGALYRCIVSGSCQPAISSPAKLMVNNPKPLITSRPLTTIFEDSLYSYRVTATNSNHDPLSYSVEKPAWLMFDPETQVLSGIPSNDDVGDHAVKLQVSNGVSSTEQSFVVAVMNTNDNPRITSKPGIVAREGLGYKYVLQGHDDDRGDVLTWTIVSKPSWLIFDIATATLKGTPDDSDTGEHQITVQLSDGEISVTQNFLLTVENINDAPVFVSTPSMETDEDENYSYSIAAQDSDRGDVLTYSVVQKPDWLSFNTTTKILTGKPNNDHRGSHVVKIQVTDGKAIVYQMFRIVVKNTNDAPVITSNPATTLNPNENYIYTIEARDDDGDKLVFDTTVIPAWLSFDKTTRILSGTTIAPGSYTVTLNVGDGMVTTVQGFTITVLEPVKPPIIIAPVPEINPTDVTLSNHSFESTITSSQEIGTFATIDEDHSAYSYQLVSGQGDEGNAFFNIVNDKLYLKSKLPQPYSKGFSIRVRSTNSHENFIEKAFFLETYQTETKTEDAGVDIPTTFSPNADGINDRWVIKSLKDAKNVFIQVLDRSGVQLYSSVDPEEGWDGLMPGGQVMEGPFFYVITVGREVKKGVLIVIK